MFQLNQPETANMKWYCDECGAEVPAGDWICENCAAGPNPPPKPWGCEKCGSSDEPGWWPCSKCEKELKSYFTSKV